MTHPGVHSQNSTPAACLTLRVVARSGAESDAAATRSVVALSDVLTVHLCRDVTAAVWMLVTLYVPLGASLGGCTTGLMLLVRISDLSPTTVAPLPAPGAPSSSPKAPLPLCARETWCR